jgi:hypothetical protein
MSSVQEIPTQPQAPPGSMPNYAPRIQAPVTPGYYQEDPRKKAAVLAMILSLMPGLGQVYVGFYQQGFLNILVVASIISILVQGAPEYLKPLLGLFLAFFWLYNIVDAGRRASFYNQALAGMAPAEIPQDFTMEKGVRSLAGGVALIVIGLLFFAHTQYGMPLEWIENWWPLGLVLMGGYLLFQAWQDKQKGKKSPGISLK